MANNSFFYGATPSPEANTVDELIDSLEDKVAIAGQSNTDAITAAAQAAESATNARVSELAAADIVVTSNANVGAAAASAQTALDAATAASNSATNSANTAAASNTSASNSAASATAAATSATNASSSATSASGSATTATTKAAEAATSATNAATSASAASSSASTATTQAGVATTQAGIATTQAGVATTQATAAASSATAASGSASAASTSASNAATSATNSAASATQSANSATASSASSVTSGTSATAAATSATNAATSATQAASSAASATAIVTGVNSSRPSISPSLNLDFANTETLDPRITFTRASTATYNGTRTALAEQNLFQYSQEFDNAYWSKNATTVTANSIAAPDGTTTADTLSAAGTGLNAILRSILHNSGSITFSIYAKAGTKSVLQIDSAQISGRANFDLATGTLGTVDAAWTASIVSAGNGWYRCIATFTGTGASGNFIVSMQDSTTAAREANSTAGDLYIWGAQWEIRSTVTAYTPTTTQPVTNYIPVLETAASGVARFDHNPTTFESLGLLIEEQRTNLLTYSEQFDNAVWIKSNATVTANTIVSPDGTLDADKLVEGATTSRKYLRNTSVTATNNVLSIYAKAGGRNFISVGTSNGSGLWGVSQFNLSTGAFENSYSVGGEPAPTSPNITSVGNGWYRISVILAGSNSPIIMVTNGGNPVFEGYTGNGFDGIYIWGAQIEAGAFATSYIPTVASQVTRAADSASMTGTNFSSWYNQAEGSVYCEVTTPVPTSTANPGFMWYSNDGTGNNRIELRQVGSGDASPRINTLLRVGAVTTVNMTVSTTTIGWTTNNAASSKISLGYKVNDVYLTSDKANAAVTDLETAMPPINQVVFSHTGNYKKLSYYPKRLSNTELQGITS